MKMVIRMSLIAEVKGLELSLEGQFGNFKINLAFFCRIFERIQAAHTGLFSFDFFIEFLNLTVIFAKNIKR